MKALSGQIYVSAALRPVATEYEAGHSLRPRAGLAALEKSKSLVPALMRDQISFPYPTKFKATLKRFNFNVLRPKRKRQNILD
jgi:hypothetical protein